MKLANAYLCLDCDEINSQGSSCIKCTSTTLHPLARLTTKNSQNWLWLKRIGSLDTKVASLDAKSMFLPYHLNKGGKVNETK